MQEVDDILELADRVFIMKSGEFVLGGTRKRFLPLLMS